MKKTTLESKVTEAKTSTHDALQLLWDNINKGQRKQLAKNPEIKALLDTYGVEVGV